MCIDEKGNKPKSVDIILIGSASQGSSGFKLDQDSTDRYRKKQKSCGCPSEHVNWQFEVGPRGHFMRMSPIL